MSDCIELIVRTMYNKAMQQTRPNTRMSAATLIAATEKRGSLMSWRCAKRANSRRSIIHNRYRLLVRVLAMLNEA